MGFIFGAIGMLDDVLDINFVPIGGEANWVVDCIAKGVKGTEAKFRLY